MKDVTTKMATRMPNRDFVFAAGVFLINVMIFLAVIGPTEQGYADVVRGWNQFNVFFRLTDAGWGPWNQLQLRLIMVAISVCEVAALYKLRLIERSTLLTYLSLPVAAYLVAKIRLEFLFFPLALISTRLPWRVELGVLAGLVGLSVVLDEKNGFVIAAFRVSLHAFRLVKPNLLGLGLIMLGVIVLTSQFSLLSSIFPPLGRYRYTRDVANPDYSILETGGVFLGSMIMSVNPFIDYAIAIPCAIVVLAIMLGLKFWSSGEWRRAVDAPDVRALLLTVVTFTSFTHAFQNARYYFFYVPVLSRLAGPSGNRRLMLLSIPVTVVFAIFYLNLGADGRAILDGNVR